MIVQSHPWRLLEAQANLVLSLGITFAAKESDGCTTMLMGIKIPCYRSARESTRPVLVIGRPDIAMKLNFNSAKKLACRYLSELEARFGGVPCSIVESRIVEDERGWYFPYQSVEFLATGDIETSLVGNWPIFVSRDGLHVGPGRPDMRNRGA